MSYNHRHNNDRREEEQEQLDEIGPSVDLPNSMLDEHPLYVADSAGREVKAAEFTRGEYRGDK